MSESQHERVSVLRATGTADQKEHYVLYWMQSAIRSSYNHALEYAVHHANGKNLPLLVVFVLADRFLHAQQRQYSFLLQGLEDTRQQLQKRDIGLSVLTGNPPAVIAELSCNAALTVTDRGYLNIHRHWYAQLKETSCSPVVQIETNVVVPVQTAYHKEAYSAGILRPKIQARWNDFLQDFPQLELKNTGVVDTDGQVDTAEPFTIMRQLNIHNLIPPSADFEGGESAAATRMETFFADRLAAFDQQRNDPSLDATSKLSPYLHFGMISPVEIALKAREYGSGTGVDVLWEEMIVRRELACNFTYYNSQYDSPACLPAWAQTTLSNHANDPREYIYSYSELEQGKTHDPYWNAAQNQMTATGWMHGYMRMYWGKKVIEWTRDIQTAFTTLIQLNDSYELDGRDPNGYAGIAWCFGKHDRAWQERSVFGKVRYMNAAGLKRKFAIDDYARQWA